MFGAYAKCLLNKQIQQLQSCLEWQSSFLQTAPTTSAWISVTEIAWHKVYVPFQGDQFNSLNGTVITESDLIVI